MKQEKKEFKEVKTSEMLDSLAKEVDYGNTPECEKREKYRDTIEEREPFSDIKSKIDSVETRLRNIEEMVKKLLGHKHDKNEKVVIDIDADNRRQFL